MNASSSGNPAARSSYRAAAAGVVLSLPMAILFSHVLLGVEPNFGPLQPLLTADESHPTSFLVLGLMLLLPVAFVINVAALRRSRRAGNGGAATRLNLAVAVATLALMLMIAGAIVVDQYPCWMGVPNCD